MASSLKIVRPALLNVVRIVPKAQMVQRALWMNRSQHRCIHERIWERRGRQRTFSGQTRAMSSEKGEDWKMWDYQQVKALVKSPKQKTILIDVREPSEYASGHIPTALNMPITTSPDAPFLSREDFEERFGFEKPAEEEEVVFYCKAGVRSRMSALLAKEAGWTVGEYRGSWMDWEKNGGGK